VTDTKPTAFYDPKLRWQKSSVQLIHELFDVVPRSQAATSVIFGIPGKEYLNTHDDCMIASNCTYEIEGGISLYGEGAFLSDVRSTAEHTWHLIHACHRDLPSEIEQARKSWDRRDLWKPPCELSNMIILIIGNGRIGGMISDIAKAYRMNVHITDNTIDRRDLLGFAGMADFVTLHCDLNPTSRGMIDQEFLSRMKDSAFLINTARAEIVNKDALIYALRNKWIRGYAADVYWNEFDTSPSILSGLLSKQFEGLPAIFTPHIAGSTVETWTKTEHFIINKAYTVIQERMNK